MTPIATESLDARDPLLDLRESLEGVLERSGGRLGLLMDGTGAVILESGVRAELDSAAFASLTVNHFGATRALAALIGEDRFGGLCHQGERTCIYVADVAGQIVLSILFDGRRTVGQVSKEGRRIVSSLEGPVRRLLATWDSSTSPLDSEWVHAARAEIDRVFREGA